MRKRGALTGTGSALLLTLVAAGAGTGPPPPSRPSVLLVTLDTTRADHLGAYGAETAHTPNLDSVAAEGVLFRRALSPTPLTLPSHATVLTGRVPRRHGVRDNAGFRLDPRVPTLAERYRAEGYVTAAFVSAAVLDRTGGLDRGFQWYDDSVRVGNAAAFGYVERAASQTTDAALARLSTLEPPFFLWVHYFDPHLPYVPPEPWRSRFATRPYDGEIAFMDQEVGRLIAAARGASDNLVVAVAGDHGESLGEHGEAAHGVFLYEATQRVPLLLAGPGIPRGKVVTDPVGLVDLAPTLAEATGLPPFPEVDGRSLSPLWKGERAPGTSYELETFYTRFAFGWAPLRALARGDWKWIDAPRPELYDVSEDPAETVNRAASRPEHARRLSEILSVRIGEDDPGAPPSDPATEERRRRLESLGYVSGGGTGDAAIDPKDAVGWLADLEAGRWALQAGAPKDGIAPLERLLRRNPDNLQGRVALGVCRLRVGDPSGAEREFRLATRLAPDRSLPWLRLGDALSVRSRTDAASRSEARKAYERALSLQPREADAYRGLLLLFAASEDGASIDSLAERAAREAFSDPIFDTEVGLLSLARGRPEAAERSLLRAVEADPRAARALEGLGRIAFGRGDAVTAERRYAEALGAEPSARLAKTLGAIRLHELGDRRGAADAFRRAVELAEPGDPDRPELESLVRELTTPL